MHQTLILAIRGKQVLELRYNGYSRLIEPHAYGADKNGVDKLRCYQVGGGSASGDPVDWKMLKVAEIGSIHLTGRHFSIARSGYKSNDPAIARIYAQL